MKIVCMLHFVICISCALPSNCYHKVIKEKLLVSYHRQQKYRSNPRPFPPPITIWIHGTRFIRRPMFDDFFNGVPQLKLAQNAPSDYYLHKIARTLSKIDPYRFSWKTFYLFGWSGKLSSTVRQEAAQYLYQDLLKLITQYKEQYKIDPVIRMITHSHGGTVALNLAKIKKEKSLHIAELILLACPVQRNTRAYIEDEIFKKTYALCSSLDMVQVLAPQITSKQYRTKKGHIRTTMHWPPYSYRCFPQNPKLTQVKIKINGRSIFHGEFNSKPFISVLPHVITTMNSWDKKQICGADGTYLLCIYIPKKKRKLRKQRSRLLDNSSSINTSIS